MEERCLLSAGQFDRGFDFGTSASPVESGWLQVTEATRYSASLGYGWQAGNLASANRSSGTALDRDFVYTRDATFWVDVPNGRYKVEAVLGDRGQYGHDLMGVFLEGTQVDSVSTAPGQVVTRSFEVEVRDSHLTAQFRDLGGRDPNVVVEALRVSATTPPGPTLFISDVQGAEGNADATPFQFIVTLSAVREESTEVDWATVNGAAVGGEDFSAASGVLSIPAGATQGTITVLVSGDQVFEPKETFSVRLTAPRGASLGDAEGIGTILNDDLRPGTTDLRAFFDFGTPTSPVAAGYERVSQQTGYVADRGYGWQSGDIRSVSRSGWGALDTDLNYTPDGTFVVDLPVGAYSVDLILGDRGSYAHDSMGVYLEGALMETVTSGSRQVLSRHYEVEVADGQLTLQLRDLGGRDKNVCIEAMRIISAEAAPQHGPGPLWPTLPELPGAWFSEPVRDANGFLVYTVESQYQASATKIRVLLPTNFTWDQVYPTVYVLPVEAGEGRQYGDGLVTVRDLGLQNVHDAIFVAPTFSNLPWYADHVSNSKIWQETYFRTVVVPFIEHQYPTPESAEGRLLLGFSKSGQGAFAMLLRHPDYFGRVVAWDSALAMSDPSTGYGYLNILGSRANFENYRITSLLQARASELKNQPTRLFLRGYSYDYTRSDHATVDRLMTQLGIPHDYRDGVYRRHVWNSGWVPEAVDLLFS